MSGLVQNIKNRQLNYANNIYNLAYIIIVVKAFYAYSNILDNVRTQTVLNLCNVIILLLLAYKLFFLQKYTMRQVFVCLFLGLLSFYTDRQVNAFMLFPDFLLIAATQDVDFKKTIEIIYKIQAAIIGLHVVAYPIMQKFFAQYVKYSIRGGESALRHQFLLSHANIFSMLLLWTILGYIYVNYPKMNRIQTIACWLVYYFFYIFTDSNSGLIILTAVVIISLLKKTFGDRVDNAVTFLARYLYLILLVLFDFMMIVFPYVQGTARDVWLQIDDFFTGRPKYGAYAFENFGFSFFGRGIQFGPKEYWRGMWMEGAPSDNAYMWISVCYGLFYALLFAYLFWKYGKKATFEEKLIIIAYSLYTMMELYVTYFNLCFAVIMIGKYIWQNADSNSIMEKTLNGSKKS